MVRSIGRSNRISSSMVHSPVSQNNLLNIRGLCAGREAARVEGIVGARDCSGKKIGEQSTTRRRAHDAVTTVSGIEIEAFSLVCRSDQRFMIGRDRVLARGEVVLVRQSNPG